MDNKEIEYSFNIKNIGEIPFDKYEQDFTFYINHKEYPTSRFLADILSPKIRLMHYSDTTCNEYHLFTITNNQERIETQEDETDYFTEFLQLYKSNKKTLNTKEQRYFSQYFLLLGNIDEFSKIFNERLKTQNETDHIQNLLEINDILQNSQQEDNYDILNNDIISDILNKVSEHFYEIQPDTMKKVSIEILKKIIGNDHLKIENEDSLLLFIVDLYEKDHKYSPLFEYIYFNNVTMETMKIFIEKFNIDHLNSNIWRSICERLLKEEETTIKLRGRYKEQENKKKEEKIDTKVIEKKHDPNHEFNGILRHLSRESGSNIHDNGTIEISSNSINSNNHPKNLVDYENNNYFNTNSEGGAIICFDFKDKLINLTNYTIKSNCNSSGINNLKNWVIEVSNDQQEWEEIDRHSNDSSLNGPNIIFTFQIKKQTSNFYQFVRLRQTGETWGGSGNKYFWFYFIEFYGKLKYNK